MSKLMNKQINKQLDKKKRSIQKILSVLNRSTISKEGYDSTQRTILYDQAILKNL